MLPTIEFGPLHLSSWAAAYVVALVVAAPLGYQRMMEGLDLPPRLNAWGPCLVVIGGFAGGWAVRIVPTLEHLIRSGEWAWVGGNSFVGVALGGFLALVLFYRSQRMSVGRALDLCFVSLPLGQAIGRLGCLAAGCCYGLPTTSSLGMLLPGHHGVWLVRYPTQLIAAGANLLIFVTLLAVERYGQARRDKPAGARIWPFDGFLFLLYLDLYSVKRFAVECLRGDTMPLIGAITWVHLYTGLLFVVSTILIVRNLQSRSTTAPLRSRAAEQSSVSFGANSGGAT